jgi:hypothetical protein
VPRDGTARNRCVPSRADRWLGPRPRCGDLYRVPSGRPSTPGPGRVKDVSLPCKGYSALREERAPAWASSTHSRRTNLTSGLNTSQAPPFRALRKPGSSCSPRRSLRRVPMQSAARGRARSASEFRPTRKRLGACRVRLLLARRGSGVMARHGGRGRVGGRRLDRAARAGPTGLVSSRRRHRTVHAVLPHTAPRRSSPGAFRVPVATAGWVVARRWFR